MTLTQLEKELLKEIQSAEVDGINMGYSEFDGTGITKEQTGVLSSLIQKGVVYDSMASCKGDHDYMPMYCTTAKGEDYCTD